MRLRWQPVRKVSKDTATGRANNGRRDRNIFDNPAIVREITLHVYRRTVRSAATPEGLTLAAGLFIPVGVPRLSIPSRLNGHCVISLADPRRLRRFDTVTPCQDRLFLKTFAVHQPKDQCEMSEVALPELRKEPLCIAVRVRSSSPSPISASRTSSSEGRRVHAQANTVSARKRATRKAAEWVRRLGLTLVGNRLPNPLGLRTKSGAAFGATLYCNLVLFGATKCDVDNRSKSFNLLLLFGSVQGSAR